MQGRDPEPPVRVQPPPVHILFLQQLWGNCVCVYVGRRKGIQNSPVLATGQSVAVGRERDEERERGLGE